MMKQYPTNAYVNTASANFAEASSACACASMSSENGIMLIMGAIMMASIIIFNGIIIRSMIALLVLGLLSIIVLLGITGKLNQPEGWA